MSRRDRYPIERDRYPVEDAETGNGRSKFGIALGVIAAVLPVMNLRDIYRYLKISNM